MNFKDLAYFYLNLKDDEAYDIQEYNENHFLLREDGYTYEMQNDIELVENIKDKYNVDVISIFNETKREKYQTFSFHLYISDKNKYYKITHDVYPDILRYETYYLECDRAFNLRDVGIPMEDSNLIENLEKEFKKQITNYFSRYPKIRLNIITGNFQTNR
jgi:hypothetical protein